MRKLTITLLLGAIIATTAVAEPIKRLDAETINTADPVAGEAILTFAELINEQNYLAMGFDSPDQIATATLGIPSEEYMIALDELKEYSAGEDAGELLHGTKRLTYPLLVGDQVRSSLTLVYGNQGWVATSYGAPNYARLAYDLRSELSLRDGQPLSEYFEVRIPAMNLLFVGLQVADELFLTPVLDNPGYGFERGVTLPAGQALEMIVPAARRHNGLPT